MPIDIPLGNEVLEVEIADLEENSANVIDLLAEVRVAPAIYLKVSFACLSNGARSLYKSFLEAGFNSTRGQHDEYRLLIINLLASDVLNELFKDKANQILHSEFRTYITEAQEIDSSAQFTILNSANYAYIKDDLETAQKFFNQVLRKDPACIPALIADAKLNLKLGMYEEALSSLQSLFLLEPQGLNTLIDISVCFYKLNMVEESIYALQRILEIDPSNSEASLLLSSIFFNLVRSGKRDLQAVRLIEESNRMLLNSSKKSSKSPIFIISVAYRCFLAGELDKSESLYDEVLRHVRRKTFIAHCHFMKSVLLQIKNKFEDASKSAIKCVDAVSHYPQYKYCLANMQIYKDKIDDAEKILKVLYDRGVTETLFLLKVAYFSSKKGDYKMLSSAISSAIASWNDFVWDSEALSIATDIASKLPSIYTLVLYERIAATLKERNIDGTAIFYNNYGVLNFEKGYDFALSKYRSENMDSIYLAYENIVLAARKLHSSSLLNKDGAKSLIFFNLARITELKSLSKAKNIYDRIIASYPEFLECRMRIINVEKILNGPEAAIHLAQSVESSQFCSLDSSINYANILMENKNYIESKRVLDTILKNINSEDPYSLCILGNINLKFAVDHPSQKADFLERSWKLFEAALHKDPRNIYGAIGVSLVTAEAGYYENARSLMLELEQLNSGNKIISQNLAHVCINQNARLGRTAIALYHKSIKLDGKIQDAPTLIALSLAYYVIAKEERDPSSMKNALSAIEKAALLTPYDLTIQLNCALVKQQISQILNEQSIEDRSVIQLKIAMKGVDTSEKIFKGLAKLDHPSYSKKYAQLRADFCDKVKLTAARKIRESSVLLKQREDRVAKISTVD